MAAALPPGTVQGSARVARVTQQGDSSTLSSSSGGSSWVRVQLEGGGSMEGSILVGCDGARSAVATRGLGLQPARYIGYAVR